MIGMIVAIVLIAIPILAIGLGFLRNWVFSLIHLILFIALGCVFTFVINGSIIPVILEANDITYEYLANYISTSLASFNTDLSSAGEQLGIGFALIEDTLTEQEFYVELLKVLFLEASLAVGFILGAIIGYGLSWLVYIPFKIKFFKKENYTKKPVHRVVAALISVVTFGLLSAVVGTGYAKIGYLTSEATTTFTSIHLAEDCAAEIAEFNALDAKYNEFYSDYKEDLSNFFTIENGTDVTYNEDNVKAVYGLVEYQKETIGALDKKIAAFKKDVEGFTPTAAQKSKYEDIKEVVTKIDEAYEEYIAPLNDVVVESKPVYKVYQTLKYYANADDGFYVNLMIGEVLSQKVTEVDSKIDLIKGYLNFDIYDGYFLSFLKDLNTPLSQFTYKDTNYTIIGATDEFSENVGDVISIDSDLIKEKISLLNEAIEPELTYVTTNFPAAVKEIDEVGFDTYIEDLKDIYGTADEAQQKIDEAIDEAQEELDSMKPKKNV